jgi:macrodomain Ter protein organizer (MatP/YcbG family)
MFDNSWIEAPCPNCGFVNDVMFRQIRLQERIICTGCHRIIQLIDEHVSAERGEREINNAIVSLKSQLKDILIKIKI